MNILPVYKTDITPDPMSREGSGGVLTLNKSKTPHFIHTPISQSPEERSPSRHSLEALTTHTRSSIPSFEQSKRSEISDSYVPENTLEQLLVIEHLVARRFSSVENDVLRSLSIPEPNNAESQMSEIRTKYFIRCSNYWNMYILRCLKTLNYDMFSTAKKCFDDVNNLFLKYLFIAKGLDTEPVNWDIAQMFGLRLYLGQFMTSGLMGNKCSYGSNGYLINYLDCNDIYSDRKFVFKWLDTFLKHYDTPPTFNYVDSGGFERITPEELLTITPTIANPYVDTGRISASNGITRSFMARSFLGALLLTLK